MLQYLFVVSFFFIAFVHTASNTTTCINPNSKDSVVKVIVTTIDGSVTGEEDKQVVWLAPDYTTVFLVTSSKSLWRSLDSGRNWENVTLESNTDGVKSVQATGDNKGVVVIGYGSHWWASSNGKSFNHSTSPGQMEDVKFHHRHTADWLIAIKKCPYFSVGCTNDLYLSQDTGIHWALLRKNVKKADWNSNNADDKFIVAWEDNISLFDSQLVYSNTFFQTDEIVVAPNVVGYKTVGQKIFIARAISGDGSLGKLSLLVSEDSGISFHTVRFPLGLDENRYTILDVTEGSTFVNVQHNDITDWGNLYSSNALGNDFVLSLEKNARNLYSEKNTCDFKAIAGLEGIYMANTYDLTDQDGTGSGKQTKITYDKGGKWNRLPQPQGSKCASTDPEDCKLNLLGFSDGNTWYTRKEAIGLILTTGSPSHYLLSSDNNLGVYMSRDAGWTWNFVTDGRYTYEIGNRGAILLLMKNDRSTGTLKYSLDEGIKWLDCVFAQGEDQVEVKEIVSDPNLQSEMFLAYGNKGDKGILISIDFTGIHERDCKGYDNVMDSSSDYEYWEPSDFRGHECLLGRQMKYVRRKQTSECLNPISFTNFDPIFVQNCPCTEEDYECDYCYVHKEDYCILDCDNYDPNQAPSDCYGTYNVTRGYRRVPGDTCDSTSGVDHMPIQKNCPDNSISYNNTPEETSGRGPLLAFLIISVLLLLMVGMWILSGYNDNVRQLLGHVIPKKYLPEFNSTSESSIKYLPVDTQLGDDDLEEDAPEIDVDKSDSENPGSVI